MWWFLSVLLVTLVVAGVPAWLIADRRRPISEKEREAQEIAHRYSIPADKVLEGLTRLERRSAIKK